MSKKKKSLPQRVKEVFGAKVGEALGAKVEETLGLKVEEKEDVGTVEIPDLEQAMLDAYGLDSGDFTEIEDSNLASYVNKYQYQPARKVKPELETDTPLKVYESEKHQVVVTEHTVLVLDKK